MWISKVSSRGGSLDKESRQTFLGCNQTKSGIGRSRSPKLDSSLVWSRGQNEANLGDKFALGKFLVRLITALGFIRFGFETLVEP